MSFVHLHNHGSHSLLDGTIKPERAVEKLREIGQPGLALTDHGGLSGAYEFQKLMTAAELQPIIGLEAYVATGRATEKTPIYFGDGGRHDASRGAYTHLTLLAMGDEGVRELYELQSKAHRYGYYYQPRVDRSWVLQSRNLIALSGCAGSELSTLIRLGLLEEAEAYVETSKYALGDRFYIEVMNHGITDDGSDGFDEAELNSILITLAAAHSVPVVVTNDAHYTSRVDASVHDALLCIQTKSQLSDPGRFKFTGDGFYLKSRAEMEELGFDGSYLDTTLEIAERCGSPSKVFSHELRMPKVAPPAGWRDRR